MTAFVAGQILTAAALNAAIDAADPLGVGAWTAYVPTLTQSAVVAKTVTSARYTRHGRWIEAQVLLSCISAGTALNAVQIGLPVPAAAAVDYGDGYIFDASAGLFFAGIAYPASTTVCSILIGNGAGIGNVAGAASGGFVAALAAGDLVSVNLNYEAAT